MSRRPSGVARPIGVDGGMGLQNTVETRIIPVEATVDGPSIRSAQRAGSPRSAAAVGSGNALARSTADPALRDQQRTRMSATPGMPVCRWRRDPDDSEEGRHHADVEPEPPPDLHPLAVAEPRDGEWMEIWRGLGFDI